MYTSYNELLEETHCAICTLILLKVFNYSRLWKSKHESHFEWGLLITCFLWRRKLISHLMKWEWSENKDLNSCSMLAGMDLIACCLFFMFWNNSIDILLVKVNTTRRKMLVIVASPWPSIHQLLTLGSTSTITKFQAPCYNTQHGFWNNCKI